MFFLASLCIVIVIFLFLKLSIRIQLVHDEEKNKVIITLSVIKNIIKLNIPLIDTEDEKEFWGIRFFKKVMNKKDKQAKPKEKTSISFSKIQDTVKKGYSQFHSFKELLNPTRNYLRKRLVCSTFFLYLDFGAGDASLTGISSGFLWGICYNILSIIDSNMILKSHDIRINPTFNEVRLHVHLNCIFNIKIVHIIIIFFILLYSIIKYFIKNVLSQKSTIQKCVRL
ncbi:MAG: DUF2953 domain-containing protein [Clostridia bacterium]